jgi:hypothetical protein
MINLMKKYLLAFLVAFVSVEVVYAAATKFTDLTVTGTLTAATSATSGNQTVTGNSTVTGDRAVAGRNVITPTSMTGVTVSSSVPAAASYYILTSTSGALVMTATPAVSTTTATNGQTMILRGVSASNTFTLQDQGTLSGSLLELGASTRVISDKKVLSLIYDSTLGEWLEQSYGNN